MTLRDTLVGVFRRNASRYLYVPMPPDRVSGGQADTAALVEGRDYFRLWLTEMSLKRDRDWFKTWHPAVQSLIRFQFGTELVEVPNIVGEQWLKNVDSAHLDRAIELNYPLTSLMPFSGGVVELTAALLAMEGQDFVKRFIGVMTNFAALVAVPQLSAALALAGPVASGIEELFGGTDGEMHLGLHQAFSHQGGGGSELRPGYLVAALATEAQLDPGTLWVADDRLRQGPSASQSTLLTGYAYLLLRIQKETVRDDWEGLSAIMTPFSTAIEALGTGDTDRADSYYRTAIAAAVSSRDLTQADRRRVAEVLKQRFAEAKDLGLGAATAWPSLTDDVAAIPVDEALAQGEPDLCEFLPRDDTGWSPASPGQ
jgi:hypothetical protein